MIPIADEIAVYPVYAARKYPVFFCLQRGIFIRNAYNIDGRAQILENARFAGP